MKATIVIALLLVYSVGQAFADPVVNSGFDTDLNGWKIEYTDIYGNIYEPLNPEGVIFDNSTAMLKILDYEQNISVITLSQALTLTSSATISFDVKFDNGLPRTVPVNPYGFTNASFFQASFLADDPVNDQTFVLNDVAGPYDSGLNPLSGTDSKGWYHFSGTITGNGILYFDLKDFGAASYSTAWVDNVVLTENVTAVPEPSMLLLLGASIAGFMSAGFLSMRRRKV
jgi:hypothetical protein